MASRVRVEEYRRLNADLVRLAERDLAAFWASLNKSNIDSARDATIAYMLALSETYGRPAALIAAQFYDDLRAASPNAAGSFRAIMSNGPAPDEIENTVRWAIGAVVGDDPDDAAGLARLSGAAQRYITEHGRNTIANSMFRDPSPGGWARVPGFSKSGNCDFCLDLASRGAIYRSKDSAKFASDGDKYHDNCHCVPTPIWDGDSIPGN